MGEMIPTIGEVTINIVQEYKIIRNQFRITKVIVTNRRTEMLNF